MKLYILSAFIFIGFFYSCSSSQKIVASWVNPELKTKKTYNSIFIIALTPDNTHRYMVENKVAKLLKERGKTVMMSNEKFPPASFTNNTITKEQIADIVRVSGCDAIFSMALLNVKTETRYQPGTTRPAYTPYGYGPGGFGYGGYYGYYQPMVYTPGYYVTDKTYFIESSLYDTATDQPVWSIQSSAYNPTSFNSWFQHYAQLMFKKLKEEGFVQK